MKSHGFRSGTRKKFKKPLRQKGMPNTSTYLQTYKNNDYVDIKINSAVTKDMPHKIYHGRTGRIFKVDERTVGVRVKVVKGNREVEEKVNIKIEHLKKSRCREEFLERSKKYFEKKEEAKNSGVVLSAKRVKKGGRGEFLVDMGETVKIGNDKFVEIF